MTDLLDTYQRDYDAMQQWVHHRHDYRLDLALWRLECSCGDSKEIPERFRGSALKWEVQR